MVDTPCLPRTSTALKTPTHFTNFLTLTKTLQHIVFIKNIVWHQTKEAPRRSDPMSKGEKALKSTVEVPVSVFTTFRLSHGFGAQEKLKNKGKTEGIRFFYARSR